jgi:hypothetical protein
MPAALRFIAAVLMASPPAPRLDARPAASRVGYDFLKQQATVTVTPSTKGLAK